MYLAMHYIHIFWTQSIANIYGILQQRRIHKAMTEQKVKHKREVQRVVKTKTKELKQKFEVSYLHIYLFVLWCAPF